MTTDTEDQEECFRCGITEEEEEITECSYGCGEYVCEGCDGTCCDEDEDE